MMGRLGLGGGGGADWGSDGAGVHVRTVRARRSQDCSTARDGNRIGLHCTPVLGRELDGDNVCVNGLKFNYPSGPA